MKLLSLVSRIAVITAVWALLGSAGFARVVAPWRGLPPVNNDHRSSLQARVTMVDGTSRTITIQGVGCAESICSRVRAKTVTGDIVWLDGLASVRAISHETDGPVKAVFTLRNGSVRPASLVPLNRVLYVQGRFGRTETLDLGSVSQVDFE
jgi:hypothetical protein